MRLVLLRHAPAEARDPRRWPDDARRPLTSAGRRAAREVTEGLRAVGVRPDRIVTSPAVRAAATARILAAGQLGEGGPSPEIWPELLYDRAATDGLDRLAREPRGGGTVVAVGHEPSLGQLVGLLLLGEGISPIRLKRGGAALIEVPGRVGPSAGRLEWAMTRRQLTGLGKHAP